MKLRGEQSVTPVVPLSSLNYSISQQTSRKPHVFPGIHFEVEHERFGRVRLDDLGFVFHEDRVLAKNFVLVHRLEFDGDEERPRHFVIDALAAFDAQHLGDFEQLHSRVHHHFFHAGRRDFRLEFVEDEMVNHGG